MLTILRLQPPMINMPVHIKTIPRIQVQILTENQLTSTYSAPKYFSEQLCLSVEDQNGT